MAKEKKGEKPAEPLTDDLEEKDDQKPTPTGEEKDLDAEKDEKKFDQDEVDKIVSDRLKRETKKYADYEDLQKKAEKLDKIEEDKKTDLEKAEAALEKEKVASEEKDRKIKEGLRRQAILSKAENLGFTDPEYVHYKLVDNEEIAVTEDYVVEGVEKVLEELAKTSPDLLTKGKKAEKPDPTNPIKGKTGETKDQQRARIYGHGVDVFDPLAAEKHGGGVVYIDSKEKK